MLCIWPLMVYKLLKIKDVFSKDKNLNLISTRVGEQHLIVLHVFYHTTSVEAMLAKRELGLSQSLLEKNRKWIRCL